MYHLLNYEKKTWQKDFSLRTVFLSYPYCDLKWFIGCYHGLQRLSLIIKKIPSYTKWNYINDQKDARLSFLKNKFG